MTETITEIGVLQKGDMCVVSFRDGRPSWMCRVAACLPYEEGSSRNSMYECITPHGSSLVTGALWVRLASKAEQESISKLENEVRTKGNKPYKGLIRLY